MNLKHKNMQKPLQKNIYVDITLQTCLNESDQSIITINPFKQEKISITSLEGTPNIIKSGEKTTLSVKATSTHTDNLTYQ